MATTNIITGGENLTGYSYLGSDEVPLGRVNQGTGDTVGQVVMGVDTALGAFDANPKPGFASDRVPNEASGVGVTGNPTYGDGKLNQNITFNPDYSYASPNAKFAYSQPMRPSSKKFTELGD